MLQICWSRVDDTVPVTGSSRHDFGRHPDLEHHQILDRIKNQPRPSVDVVESDKPGWSEGTLAKEGIENRQQHDVDFSRKRKARMARRNIGQGRPAKDGIENWQQRSVDAVKKAQARMVGSHKGQGSPQQVKTSQR